MSFLNLEIPADSGFLKPVIPECCKGLTLSDNDFTGLYVLKYFSKNFQHF